MPPQQLQKIADNWKNNKGKIISAYQKYELYQYKIANPDTCFREMSELFSEKFQAGSNFIYQLTNKFSNMQKVHPSLVSRTVLLLENFSVRISGFASKDFLCD